MAVAATPTNLATLGDRVRQRREERHLKRDDLAAAVGISWVDLRLLERNQYDGELPWLPGLAHQLGVTVDWLKEGGPLPLTATVAERLDAAASQMPLAAWLKAMRTAAHLTVGMLAEKARVSPKLIEHLESGALTKSYQLPMIAQALGTVPPEFGTGLPPPQIAAAEEPLVPAAALDESLDTTSVARLAERVRETMTRVNISQSALARCLAVGRVASTQPEISGLLRGTWTQFPLSPGRTMIAAALERWLAQNASVPTAAEEPASEPAPVAPDTRPSQQKFAERLRATIERRGTSGYQLARQLDIDPGEIYALLRGVWNAEKVNGAKRTLIIERLRSWLGERPDGEPPALVAEKPVNRRPAGVDLPARLKAALWARKVPPSHLAIHIGMHASEIASLLAGRYLAPAADTRRAAAIEKIEEWLAGKRPEFDQEPQLTEFGRRIETARGRQSLTLRDLAAIVGVSTATLWRIERLGPDVLLGSTTLRATVDKLEGWLRRSGMNEPKPEEPAIAEGDPGGLTVAEAQANRRAEAGLPPPAPVESVLRKPAPATRSLTAETEIVAGVCVRLNSGGPTMTVISNDASGVVQCVWFVDASFSGPFRADFPAVTLRRISD